MPYFITVLALVVIGVGFTLFNQQEDLANTEANTTPTEIVSTEEIPSTTSPSVPTDTTVNTPTQTPTEPAAPAPQNTPSSPQPSPTQPTTPTPPKAPAPAPVPASTYTDGTYYATKSYRTPDGTYEMTVGLTVKGDTVTNSTVTYDSEGTRSSYSKRFNSGYQNQVIGKDLGSINLSRVSGSSLTTAAFNNALSSIKSQAS